MTDEEAKPADLLDKTLDELSEPQGVKDYLRWERRLFKMHGDEAHVYRALQWLPALFGPNDQVLVDWIGEWAFEQLRRVREENPQEAKRDTTALLIAMITTGGFEGEEQSVASAVGEMAREPWHPSRAQLYRYFWDSESDDLRGFMRETYEEKTGSAAPADLTELKRAFMRLFDGRRKVR